MAGSGRTATFDLREDFVDDAVLGHGPAQGGIQAFEQLRNCLAVTGHERDPRLLTHCSQNSAPYRRDLADGDLPAGVIEEGLKVTELDSLGGCLVHRSQGWPG